MFEKFLIIAFRKFLFGVRGSGVCGAGEVLCVTTKKDISIICFNNKFLNIYIFFAILS